MDSKDTNISIGGLARPLARGARDESQERLSSLVRATPPAISRVARAYKCKKVQERGLFATSINTVS